MQFKCSLPPLGENELINKIHLPAGQSLHHVPISVEREAGRVMPHLPFPRSPWRRGWDRTILAAKVRRIRPYDLRHAFASLLIAAGKNPLYIARQMGHYSALRSTPTGT